MATSEFDALERDLLEAADIWFSQALHQKVKRLIAIAREGKAVGKDMGNRIAALERGMAQRMVHVGSIELTGADE